MFVPGMNGLPVNKESDPKEETVKTLNDSPACAEPIMMSSWLIATLDVIPTEALPPISQLGPESVQLVALLL